MIRIDAYRPEHFEGIRALWDEAFPDDPPRNRAELSIPAKLEVQPDLLLIAIDGDQVIGTAMAGYDGHRGWLNAVAVRGSHQRCGVGALLVAEAERRLRALGCAKVNLQVRATNAAVVRFYEKLGYAVEERVSMGKTISPQALA